MAYMVEHDGKVVGPYSLEEMSAHIASNVLLLTDRACDTNSNLWLPIAQILSPRPSAIAHASNAPSASLFDRNAGLFAGAGGVFLTALFFFWRALRLMNLYAHYHHHR